MTASEIIAYSNYKAFDAEIKLRMDKNIYISMFGDGYEVMESSFKLLL
jgi:hypothetical protein